MDMINQWSPPPGDDGEDEQTPEMRPRVHLRRDPVGTGKTQDIIEVGAEEHLARRGKGRKHRPVHNFVPTHLLSEEVAERWREDTGLTAATIAGRLAKNPRDVAPERADPDWCRFCELVQTTIDAGMPVETTCCKYTHPANGAVVECRHYAEGESQCGYQKQFVIARECDFISMPHQNLSHAQNKLIKSYLVHIDEDFIDALTYYNPVFDKDDRRIRGLYFPVKDLLRDYHPDWQALPDFDANHYFGSWRTNLHTRIQRQIEATGDVGGLQKTFFEGMATSFGMGKMLEYEMLPSLDLRPNVKAHKLRQLKSSHAELFAMRARGMFVIRLCEEMLRMMDSDEDITVSGNVFLYRDKDTDETCIGLRGLKPVVDKWRAKDIVVSSATMPDIEFMRYVFPGCDLLPSDDEEFRGELPVHTRDVQIRNAPTAMHRARKEDNMIDLRRFAMGCALEHDATGTQMQDGKEVAMTLLGVQQEIEKAIVEAKPALPIGVDVGHFNGMAGIDQYRNIRVMITVGTTLVPPKDVENAVAAITGREPERLPPKTWYPKTLAHIRMRDGTLVETVASHHPDRLVELMRQHKHDAASIQLAGRARPYGRTADNVLFMYRLTNVPSEFTPDMLLDWEKDELAPLALIEPMAISGFIVLTPQSLCALWPDTFKSADTADRNLEMLRDPASLRGQRIQAILSRWRPFTVQKVGARQKRRQGYYNPLRHADVGSLRGVVEAALGPDLRLKEG